MGIAAAIGAALLLPAAMAWVFLHPPKKRHRRTPLSAHDIAFEHLTLRSADGVRLAAWYVPPRLDLPTRGAIVICHGYFGHRGKMLWHLRFLHAAGYALLLFDFRAHGWSDGAQTTFGVTEPRDLTAAIDWMVEQPAHQGLPLAVVSESMGAAVAILTAAEDPRIQALVADSSFTRFDGAMQSRLTSLFGRHFADFIGPHVRRHGEQILGTPCENIAPIDAIGRIAPRPLLLMQGTADEVVSPSCLNELYAAADARYTAKWALEGARHVQRRSAAQAVEYEKRVLAFLETSLPAPS